MFKIKTLIAAGAAVILLPALAYLAGTASRPGDETAATPSVANAPVLPVAIAAPKEPEPRVEWVKIKSGDNLMDVLTGAGAERFDAHVAIQSLDGIYDPRRDLRIGDELQVTMDPVREQGAGSGTNASALDYVLAGLRLPVSYDREVMVDRNEDGGF
ncbi:MAG: hypothetical protein QMB76_01660, partial [Alphaproteobacteria bacterium]